MADETGGADYLLRIGIDTRDLAKIRTRMTETLTNALRGISISDFTIKDSGVEKLRADLAKKLSALGGVEINKITLGPEALRGLKIDLSDRFILSDPQRVRSEVENALRGIKLSLNVDERQLRAIEQTGRTWRDVGRTRDVSGMGRGQTRSEANRAQRLTDANEKIRRQVNPNDENFRATKESVTTGRGPNRTTSTLRSDSEGRPIREERVVRTGRESTTYRNLNLEEQNFQRKLDLITQEYRQGLLDGLKDQRSAVQKMLGMADKKTQSQAALTMRERQYSTLRSAAGGAAPDPESALGQALRAAGQNVLTARQDARAAGVGESGGSRGSLSTVGKYAMGALLGVAAYDGMKIVGQTIKDSMALATTKTAISAYADSALQSILGETGPGGRAVTSVEANRRLTGGGGPFDANREMRDLMDASLQFGVSIKEAGASFGEFLKITKSVQTANSLMNSQVGFASISGMDAEKLHGLEIGIGKQYAAPGGTFNAGAVLRSQDLATVLASKMGGSFSSTSQGILEGIAHGGGAVSSFIGSDLKSAAILAALQSEITDRNGSQAGGSMAAILSALTSSKGSKALAGLDIPIKRDGTFFQTLADNSSKLGSLAPADLGIRKTDLSGWEGFIKALPEMKQWLTLLNQSPEALHKSAESWREMYQAANPEFQIKRIKQGFETLFESFLMGATDSKSFAASLKKLADWMAANRAEVERFGSGFSIVFHSISGGLKMILAIIDGGFVPVIDVVEGSVRRLMSVVSGFEKAYDDLSHGRIGAALGDLAHGAVAPTGHPLADGFNDKVRSLMASAYGDFDAVGAAAGRLSQGDAGYGGANEAKLRAGKDSVGKGGDIVPTPAKEKHGNPIGDLGRDFHTQMGRLDESLDGIKDRLSLFALQTERAKSTLETLIESERRLSEIYSQKIPTLKELHSMERESLRVAEGRRQVERSLQRESAEMRRAGGQVAGLLRSGLPNPNVTPGMAPQGSGGSTGGTWQTDLKHLASGMGLRAISEYRPGAVTRGFGTPSLHATGQAIDFAGSKTAMAAFFNEVKKDYSGHIRQLLYSPLGQVTNNRYDPAIHNAITRSDHYSHVHAALSAGRAGAGLTAAQVETDRSKIDSEAVRQRVELARKTLAMRTEIRQYDLQAAAKQRESAALRLQSLSDEKRFASMYLDNRLSLYEDSNAMFHDKESVDSRVGFEAKWRREQILREIDGQIGESGLTSTLYQKKRTALTGDSRAIAGQQEQYSRFYESARQNRNLAADVRDVLRRSGVADTLDSAMKGLDGQRESKYKNLDETSFDELKRQRRFDVMRGSLAGSDPSLAAQVFNGNHPELKKQMTEAFKTGDLEALTKVFISFNKSMDSAWQTFSGLTTTMLERTRELKQLGFEETFKQIATGEAKSSQAYESYQRDQQRRRIQYETSGKTFSGSAADFDSIPGSIKAQRDSLMADSTAITDAARGAGLDLYRFGRGKGINATNNTDLLRQLGERSSADPDVRGGLSGKLGPQSVGAIESLSQKIEAAWLSIQEMTARPQTAAAGMSRGYNDRLAMQGVMAGLEDVPLSFSKITQQLDDRFRLDSEIYSQLQQYRIERDPTGRYLTDDQKSFIRGFPEEKSNYDETSKKRQLTQTIHDSFNKGAEGMILNVEKGVPIGKAGMNFLQGLTASYQEASAKIIIDKYLSHFADKLPGFMGKTKSPMSPAEHAQTTYLPRIAAGIERLANSGPGGAIGGAMGRGGAPGLAPLALAAAVAGGRAGVPDLSSIFPVKGRKGKSNIPDLSDVFPVKPKSKNTINAIGSGVQWYGIASGAYQAGEHGGALQGAITGAAEGASIGGGLGAAIGGIIGLGAGLFSHHHKKPVASNDPLFAPSSPEFLSAGFRPFSSYAGGRSIPGAPINTKLTVEHTVTVKGEGLTTEAATALGHSMGHEMSRALGQQYSRDRNLGMKGR